ncbi:MAG: hypothetical protein Q7T55_10000 [Solirubrobacteraceae bacterium]|nr:hypothetical protein [Solirubrobacteraceae bacterium]
MSKQEELVALEVEGLATQVLVCWEDGDIVRQLTNARQAKSLIQLKQPTGEYLLVAPERIIAVHVSAAKGTQLTEVLERLTVARAFSELN